MKTILEEFVAWVGAQPPRKRYEFIDSKNCALAQFARAFFGAQYVNGGVYSFSYGEDAIHFHTVFIPAPTGQQFAWGEALIDSKTFGQLAKRLALIMENL